MFLDFRRLRLLPFGYWRLKYFLYWLFNRRDWANAFAYLYATLFTRDAGLAIMDPLYRRFPQLAPYPRQIEIEITTACNLKCRFCEHTYWSEQQTHMSYDQFMHIMKMFPNIKWIGLTGIGSGFLNPRYMDMLRFLKNEKKCFVEFFDHFSKIKSHWLSELVEIGVDKVWVSLENAHAESYNKNRIGSDFNIVIKNINHLIDIKLEKKSPLPELWFHYIIMKQNIGEMEDYIDLVVSLTNRVRHISPPFIYFTNLLGFDEVQKYCVTIPDNLKERIIKKCKKANIFFAWNENVTHDKPMNQCTKWTEPFILATGHLQPCCAVNEANTRDYQKKNGFINVFQNDFHYFWYGKGMKKFLSDIRMGNINPICKYCHIFKHPEIKRINMNT